jgi:signal transduction histidine kinase
MLDKFFKLSEDKGQKNINFNELTTGIIDGINLTQAQKEEFTNYLKDFFKEFQTIKEDLSNTKEQNEKLTGLLVSKEKLLDVLNKKLTLNEEELTGYINRIFEQQERERIVKWIVDSIRESLDTNQVLAKIVEEVGKLLKVDRCLIALFDSETSSFVFHDEFRINNDIKSVIESMKKFDTSQDWLKPVFEKHESVVIDDVNSCSFLDNYDLCQNNIKSCALIPIVYKEDFLGAIIVHQVTHHRKWRESHIEIIKYIGSQIAVAIKQAKLFSDIKEQSKREHLLRSIINTVRSTLLLGELKNKIVTEIGQSFNADKCFIRLYNEEEDCFLPIDSYSMYISPEFTQDISNIANPLLKGHEYIKEDNKNKKYTIISKSTIENYDDEKKEALNEIIETFKFKTAYTFPIFYLDMFLGTLYIVYKEEEKNINTEDHELIKTLAGQIGIALYQADLYSKSEETNKLKSEFLASMSHEFRTPLNAIIGFSEMMQGDESSYLTEKHRRYLNNISTSGKHLLRLINDILDLSKIESGNMELNYERFNHKQIIAEIVSVVESAAMKKNIEIKLNVEDSIVRADSKKFRQIMYNLLSNAVKFTEENGKVKVISLITENKLKIEVEDTGIGIAKDNFSKIFTRFKQLDSSYTRKQEGTGLGLALSQKLVELHRGEIGFESEQGKGSKFWFIIPVN